MSVSLVDQINKPLPPLLREVCRSVEPAAHPTQTPDHGWGPAPHLM